MTWEEKIKTRFSIETGDGKLYLPLLKGAEMEKEFNTSSFEFINVHGTLVDRKKPQSRKFPLVFYFDGADNIDISDQFEASCDDPRQWIVTHPYYGVVNGQPLSIKRDDSSLNITEITVMFWESISPNYPFSNFSKKDNTRDQYRTTVYALSIAGTKGVEFTPADISAQTDGLNSMASDLQDIQDNNTYADFQNALNEGLKAIDNLLAEPLSAIQTVQNFLDLPTVYEQAIKGRVAAYENIYWRLKDSIENVTDKKYYESMAGTVLSAISVVLVTPFTGDYVTVSDVEHWINSLRTIYQDYRDTLDGFSVGIYDVTNAYSPDAEAQAELDSLITYVTSNLYAFSFGAKTERIVVLQKDTNVILLTHRYLGLDDDDENIQTFVKMNNIKLDKLYSIKKGTEIKYLK